MAGGSAVVVRPCVPACAVGSFLPDAVGHQHRRASMDDASRAAQGMTVRREVLGDAHVDRAIAGATAVSRAFAVAQQVLAEAG
jgi:hypothetical protein